jgi:spore germination protein YaaH
LLLLPLLLGGVPSAAIADPPLRSPGAGSRRGEWMPHAVDSRLSHASLSPVLDSYQPWRDPGDRPDRTVYGYWPFWGAELSSVPIAELTHLAIFSVELQADGTLGETQRWHQYAPEAMALAAPYGVHVHLCLTSFSDAVMAAVLPSPAKRAIAVSQLADLVAAYAAQGVNLDFEGLDYDLKADFVSFVSETSAAVDEVYLAMPAVDWTGAYDFDQLAFASDGLFIMGYGYHWSGGDPGPIAPLYGGSPWGVYCLDWTVADYRTWGAPEQSLVLGLPLYGRDWPTTGSQVPGQATGSGSAVLYRDAVPQGEGYGRHWEELTHTPYAFPTEYRQLWYDDAVSLDDKSAYAVAEQLQGFGFWALTYAGADSALWSVVDAASHFDVVVEPPQPGRPGELNTLSARNVTPGGRVDFLWGRAEGEAPLADCTRPLGVGDPHHLGGAAADADGVASIQVMVPPAAAGVDLLLQAVEVGDCETSELLRFRFFDSRPQVLGP